MQDSTTQAPDYDAVTFDENDDVLNTDIKINPDFYIHMAILRSQKALLAPNVSEGLLQYRLLIEQIEVICKSAGLVDEVEYTNEVKVFSEKEELQKENNPLIKSARIAGEKLRLLLKEVFNNKVHKTPLKV